MSEKTVFEQQRDALIAEIAETMEKVLNGLNNLNRGLEGVTTVGRELESVETLWNHFETGVAEGKVEEEEGEETVQDGK